MKIQKCPILYNIDFLHIGKNRNKIEISIDIENILFLPVSKCYTTKCFVLNETLLTLHRKNPFLCNFC